VHLAIFPHFECSFNFIFFLKIFYFNLYVTYRFCWLVITSS
jgi:hypothetical protein